MFVRMLKLPEQMRASTIVDEGGHPRGGAMSDRSQGKMIEWWGPVIHEYYAGTEGNGYC